MIAVAVLRQRPAREIEGTAIRFVKVARRKFYGYQDFEVFGRTVRLSTAAKTIVDCVDRPDLCGGRSELARVMFGGASQVDPAVMIEDALRMRSTALLQRLGFLTDLVGWRLNDALRARLRAAIPASARSHFGRAERQEADIGYVHDWGIFVHASRRDLLADVPQIASAAA